MKFSNKFKNNLKKRFISSILFVSMLLVISQVILIFAPFYKNESQIDVANIEDKFISEGEETAATSVTDAPQDSDGAVLADSIVQTVKDYNFADGDYVFKVTGSVNGVSETIDYPVEIINYVDDVHYSLADGETTKTISLGDSTTDYKMLIVKYHKNLIVDKGVTVTATNVSNLTYKKGMYICVMGDLKNSGTISMTARGTYNCAGENVFLWKNKDDSYEYIPAVGGFGGAAAVLPGTTGKNGQFCPGRAGNNGVNRGTGGGGSGAAYGGWYSGRNIKSGKGGNGTSYSGGSGSGGIMSQYQNTSYSLASENASDIGGKGGNSRVYRDGNWKCIEYGGIGNLNGFDTWGQTRGGFVGTARYNSRPSGTGGLLIIYTDSLYNMGKIESNGTNNVCSVYGSWSVGGGASGAGSVNVFCKKKVSVSSITATSGKSTGTNYNGGNGGNGSVTINQIAPDLIYNEKEIKLQIGESFVINSSAFEFINQNELQSGFFTMGSLSFESLDSSIAVVNDLGKIIGIKSGNTKIKIIDNKNLVYTYIHISVIENSNIKLDEGNNFTIALKQNGTVWTYGLNNVGQLGIGNNYNKDKPMQTCLNDVVDISAGLSHAMALLKNGEVYVWGSGANGQLGNGLNDNSDIPIKVGGLKNIIKIDAYKNINSALDKDGKVFIWGEGYSSFPMKVISSKRFIDISGNIVLDEKGYVYNLANLEQSISGLQNIRKISAGAEHYLALSVYGTAYVWGKNTYGETNNALSGTYGVIEAGFEMDDISAGNAVSLLLKDNDEVFVLGNNANGQIGLSTTAKATTLTKIFLDEKVEYISAGEGNHTGLVDKKGYVWHAGLNTYGELGIENTENKNVYYKTGSSVINNGQENLFYLDIGEQKKIFNILENTYNLKVDLIDDNQDNFNIELSTSSSLNLQNGVIVANDYGVTEITITHIPTGKTKIITIIVVMKMESIVQGFRDANLADGTYEILINNEVYEIELINYYDNVEYLAEENSTRLVELGDSSTNYKTLVVKYHGDLTVGKGVTLTTTRVNGLTYKKGMYLCVLGQLKNDGEITMTGRGTYNCEGQDVYLWKNIDNSYEYVPANGSNGGNSAILPGKTVRYSQNTLGKKGDDGINRSTAGGGSGAAYGGWYSGSNIKSGKGGNGTSFSGGSGSGGIMSQYQNTSYALSSEDASDIGGPGGKSRNYRDGNWSCIEYGGIGNGNGYDTWGKAKGSNVGTSYYMTRESGTGGLLIVYTDILLNNGIISANGINNVGKLYGSWSVGGGASGGGSVNLFCRINMCNGTISSNGGVCKGVTVSGGAGGNGSVTLNELGSILNYSEKKISLKAQDIYQINKSDVSYIKLNEIQTEDLILGNLKFETLDSSIASVDADGKIVAKKEGTTKIKIIDELNNNFTYIVINVVSNDIAEPMIDNGLNHTIALKSNGTVWVYGDNIYGQLGNNCEDASNEPVQVIKENGMKLENIVKIAANGNSNIVVDNNGLVYIWGLTYDENGEEVVCKSAIMVQNLSNICEVSCFEDNYYAIDINGKMYAWGKDYKQITLIESEHKIVKVSGDIVLCQNGLVYHLNNLNEAIDCLSGIVDISAGSDSYLCLNLDGLVYSFGKNNKGQLGNGTTNDSEIPCLVKNQDGFLSDIIAISAGNQISMAIDNNGNAYAWGNNEKKQIGFEESVILKAEKIEVLQDKNESKLELKKIMIVAAGNDCSSIADENGYVYSVGVNINGQLGTADNVNRMIYTQVGVAKIVSIPDFVILKVGDYTDFSIVASNGFNLKTDITTGSAVEIENKNIKNATIEKIEGVDNSNVNNLDNFVPNYRAYGEKIGRFVIVAKNGENIKQNIWINVVDSENVKSSAKVVNGKEFTIALKSDGTVWSFGNNSVGQLGLGDTVVRSIPEKIEISEDIIDVSAGENHVLLLGKSGKVYTFGGNSYGQLGTGNLTTYKAPTDIGLNNIKKVVANDNTSLCIDENGFVYVWGEGYTKNPVKLDIEKNVIDICKDYYLSDEGKVYKLQDNQEILLSVSGQGTVISGVVDDKIVQIEEGTDHVIMLGESGRAYTYGVNTYGQLGDGTTSSKITGVSTAVFSESEVLLEQIVEVSAGDRYSTVITADGKVYACGMNSNKQLGFDNNLEENGIQDSLYVALKEDINDVIRVSSGYNHTAVFKNDGNVYTWGAGNNGELGNGNYFDYYEPQQVGKNCVETNVSEILMTVEDSCDVDAFVNYFNLFKDIESELVYEVLDGSKVLIDADNGKLMAIDSGRTTVIVREKGTDKIAVIPVRILEKNNRFDGLDVLVEPQVETYGSHTVMLKVDGSVWTYGIGEFGELGTGVIQNSDKPVKVKFPEGTVITKVAAGEYHCLALDSNGNVWTWGRNNYYQQGNIGTSNYLEPVKLSSLLNIKDIACGTYTSFVVNDIGEVFAWGLNANGECGIGSYTSKIGITKVKYLSDVIDIKAGKNHTIALKQNGEVYVTGSNLYGEVGLDSSVRKVNEFTKIETLKNIILIAAGESNSTVVKEDGTVWTWGANIYKELGLGDVGVFVNVPTKVTGLFDIRYIDGGKGYNFVLNNNNEVFEVGLNAQGELGKGDKNNESVYSKLNGLSDVIYMSCGNAYSAFIRKDGTVWACGDYSHGDEDIKSKTKSVIPVQVGNDETDLGKIEITIAVGESEQIADNCAYEFNLINLDKNFEDSLSYVCLNEDIAEVNELGEVVGIKVGRARANAISSIDNKVYSVLINVTQDVNQVAPKVVSGDNFAAVLKADGDIWTYGYNGDGRLATGNYLTKDTPIKTNIISTYSDVKAGDDFIIALRADGTVWSSGNNSKGQLGNGTTKGRNKLSQVQGLNDIVAIDACCEYAVALDSLGLVYVWGDNSDRKFDSLSNRIVSPKQIDIGSVSAKSISLGNSQIVILTTKGEVIGVGNILSGKLNLAVENIVKTEVSNDSIYLLTAEGVVYKYSSGSINQVKTGVLDIYVTNGNVMYQSFDEKAYVSGNNMYGELGVGNISSVVSPIVVSQHGDNVYSMGIGDTNSYIIDNLGNVYASGNNEYGSIGNGTRINQNEHILVGERKFDVDKLVATMYVSDREDVVISGNPFNVFDNKNLSSDEFNWSVYNSDVVSVENGVITAEAEGTAYITIEDKITKESINLTRIVIEPNKDRINEIKVNNDKAFLEDTSTADSIKYKCQVVTDDDFGTLKILTNDTSDRIRINGSDEYSYNGSFIQNVELVDKFTEFDIEVGVQNNAGEYELSYMYHLIVEKISDDIRLNRIVVKTEEDTGVREFSAVPVSVYRYEAIVPENTVVSDVEVVANSKYSSISIDGLDYELEQQIKKIIINGDYSKEVKIYVKTEAGNEVEYTLVIYKESEVLNLSSLKVNDKVASQISEGAYAVTVDKDCNSANIEAIALSNLVNISIDEDEFKSNIATKVVDTVEDMTEVSIKLVQGDNEKIYTLYIYKEIESNNTVELDMIVVNGVKINAQSDGNTYIAYLPSSETTANIRAIAKDSDVMVDVDGECNLGDSSKDVDLLQVSNEFKVILTKDDVSSEYNVIIRKAEADTSLDKIIVSKNDYEVEAVLQKDGTYLAKIPRDLDKVDVTAITGYIKSKVRINAIDEFRNHTTTQEIEIDNEQVEVTISVVSEDELTQTQYTLIIKKMSDNCDLLDIKVNNDNNLVVDSDGVYHYYLKSAEKQVKVYAIAQFSKSKVKIESSDYKLFENEKLIDITAKQTEVKISVKSEAGTVKTYSLIVEGLPDDASIKSVVVNGKKATYFDGENRYEIRSEDVIFNINVELNDSLAKLVLNNGDEAIGSDSIVVSKNGSKTSVEVKVTSQNGLETELYTIDILEKSSNCNLDMIKVNGKIINPSLDGTYYAPVKNATTKIVVEAYAEDSYASTNINNNVNDYYIDSFEEIVVDGKTVYNYDIKVVAEDGTEQLYNLMVEQLECNLNVTSVKVGSNDVDLNDCIIDENGNYYKIERIQDAYVSVELESSKSKAYINENSGEVVKLKLDAEKNVFGIRIVAEDGTEKMVSLVIEKMSNDTRILKIEGESVLNTEMLENTSIVYVDEDYENVDLKFILNNSFAKVKLDTEDDSSYQIHEMIKNIDLTNYEDEGMINVNLNILAEDGTLDEHLVVIYKSADTSLSSVSINSEEIVYNKDLLRYEKIVNNGNKPVITISANNPLQTVQLLNEGGTVLASGTAAITSTQTLSTSDLTTKYVIKVISHNGENYGVETYDLWIRQKSTEIGISYIKVDGLGTIVSDDKVTYSATVSGKDKYPVEVKLKDVNAEVRIEDLDGNVLVEKQFGNLYGELAVDDGATKTFKVIVKSENGEIKQYSLNIERISSNLNIESIVVQDFDEADGETIIERNISSYDEDSKTYKIVVNRYLTSTLVKVKAVSDFTNIILDNTYNANGTVQMNKDLIGLGINRITMNLTAADGTQELRYIDIVQLSDEIGIQEVKVDGKSVESDDSGNFEVTVSDEFDLSSVEVILPIESSRVSINGEIAELGNQKVNISKGNNRKKVIPIKVTAEDGTSYDYSLTMNIISHDTSVKEVLVDDEVCVFDNNKYKIFIDRFATSVKIDVLSRSEYSVVEHLVSDSEKLSGIQKLSFIEDISDLNEEVHIVKFTVIAEDGTEKEYEIELIRNSNDNSIGELFVDNVSLNPVEGDSIYPDGSYYVTTIADNVLVKVVANNEYARVEFNDSFGINSLEQIVTLDLEHKVTAVPVKIISQQGEEFDTVIYVEKVSDNYEIESVRANYELVNKLDDVNQYNAYIYDTIDQTKVEIKAVNEYAMIYRTNEEGNILLDESGVSYEGKGSLTFDIDTLDKITVMYFKIVAENLAESDVYTLQIEKMSTDNSLESVYVEGIKIEPDENGKYYARVLDTNLKPLVQATTTHLKANLRILLGDEKEHIASENVAMSNGLQTVVPITVRSQAGSTKVHYLYISKISTSVELTTVQLNGEDAQSYNKDTRTYRFLVNSSNINNELFIMAENEFTVLEYEGIEYGASLRINVEIPDAQAGRTIKIKAKSESGYSEDYTIEFTGISDDVELDYLKVNNLVQYPDEEGSTTYSVIIPNKATSIPIEVQTSHAYSTVRIGDNSTKTHYDKGTLNCKDLSQGRIVVPIIVTAADGVTVKTYNIVLIRGSDDTNIKLMINGNEVLADSDGNYELKLPESLDKIDIVAEATYYSEITNNYAAVDLNSSGIFEKQFKYYTILHEEIESKKIINVPLVVIAEDGTRRENVIIINIQKGAFITGKIITDNFEGKHSAIVSLYDSNDTKHENLIKSVDLREDGTFKVLIYIYEEDVVINDVDGDGIPDELQKKYDIVVSKEGYLDYVMTNIEVEDEESTDIGEYKLIAGNVVISSVSEGATDGKNVIEQIEIDDLVIFNDNFGIIITDENRALKSKFDFNEDGIIDEKDRAILKKNYGKIAFTEQWINPRNSTIYSSSRVGMIGVSVNEDFVLPIQGDYVITSEYGERVHPVTGESKLHGGIDIVGEHHGNILSVADGEVTFVGVQSGYGNCVEIKHIVNGETVYSFYAHLSKIEVSLGEKVTRGSVIGIEGGDKSDPNPGTSTGHHLHFEMRKSSCVNGLPERVNPREFLKF